MDIGILSLSYSFKGYTFDEFLQSAKEIGFTVYELSTAPGAHRGTIRLDDEGLEEIKRKSSSLGLAIYALGGYTNFVKDTTQEMEEEIAKVMRYLDIAQKLGAKVIRVFGGEPNPNVPESEWKNLIARGLKECASEAVKRGIYLGLENHGYITNKAEVELEILEKVNSPFVRLTVDTSNYYWFGNDLPTVERYYKMVAPYCVHTHLKDGSARNGFREKYISLALGEGELPLTVFLDELLNSGFKGPLCIEYEGEEDAKIGAKKGYDFLKQYLSKREG
ncbi:sugar phosphate isomerase/epimerase [bacterium]|nr:sugar phosphate isomerase/epimerase [bacterium]